MTHTALISKLKKHRLLALLSALFVVIVFVYYFLLSAPSLAKTLIKEPVLSFVKIKEKSKPPSTPKQTPRASQPSKEKSTLVNQVTASTSATATAVAKQTAAKIVPTTITVLEPLNKPTEKVEVAPDNIENYRSNSSIELISNAVKKRGQIWDFSADVRAVYSGFDRELNNGDVIQDNDLLIRLRADAIATLSDNLRAGFGIAGTCASTECDADFILQSNISGSTGLKAGQITIDEMYLHWLSDEPNRFNLGIGRMQTRSVLKTGIFNKSLDRINSNNARINWTDGVHIAYQFDNGWTSNFIMQYNSKKGSGNVYHSAIDFADRDAKWSYFTSLENNQEISGITQRSIGISYLPSALLSSQGAKQELVVEHEDYIGVVGKVAWQWPDKINGYTLRGGFEAGYSPTLPSPDVVGIVDEKDVSGLAWNAVFNIMDIFPGQNLGINYAQTGAGWQLSPQYKPNTKLLEFRYQWLLKSKALFEARVRWQDQLEDSEVIAANPVQDNQTDFYLRLTRKF